MILHTVKVENRTISSIDPRRFVQNGIDADELVLDLDAEWSEVNTTIITFKNSAIEDPIALIYSGDPIKVPKTILSEVGSLTISVTGYGEDMKRVITEAMTQTNIIGNITASGIVPEFEGDPEEENPDIWAQLISIVTSTAENEPIRVASEEARVVAENERVEAENARVEAENQRASAETAREQSWSDLQAKAEQAIEAANNAAEASGERSLYAYADPDNDDMIIIEYPAFLESDDGGSIYLTLEGSDT